MEILTSALLLIGVFFIVVASLGVHRMRDPYSRLHATSKSGTLGIICVLLASLTGLDGVALGDSTKQLLTILFLIITVPAAAHMVVRGALAQRIRPWKPHAPVSDAEEKIMETVGKRGQQELQKD